MTKDIAKQEFCATTTQCLICNSQVKVSKRSCYGIFDNHVTKASGIALCTIISRILEVEIREDLVHSNVVCKSCFKILNEVDDMEVRTEELKRKINANYQESIRMLNELNLNSSEHCSIERKKSLELPDTDEEQSIKYEANNKTTEDVQQEDEGAQQEGVGAEEGEVANRDCNNEMQVMATDDAAGEVYKIRVMTAVDVTEGNEIQHLLICDGSDGECNENIQQVLVYGDNGEECNENIQLSVVNDPDGECNENIEEMIVYGDTGEEYIDNPDGEYNESAQEKPTDGVLDAEVNEKYIQEMPVGDDHDGECSESIQETLVDGDHDGEYFYNMEEVDAAAVYDDDPDYIPTLEEDVKPLTRKKRLKVTVKTKKEQPSLPEKIVERDGTCFVCLLCSDDYKIMGDRKVIAAHLKDIHSIKVFICDMCLQCFTKRNDLSEHLDNHVATEEGEFYCEVCSDVFHSISLLEIHKRLHFPQTKMWTCETCGKSYSSRNMLEEHINTHTGLRPYVCKDCGKAYATRCTYKVHMKTHEDRERRFTCDQCGKAFFHAANLKHHEEAHSGTRSYVCEQCGKAFVTAHYLRVHSVIHRGYKSFVCLVCGKDFARKFELVIHERTHTGERPYQCELCGAQFSRRNNLESHKRDKHFQEKRYRCTVCDKGYKRQRLLDYHIKAAHTGERPLKCPKCNATFIYPHRFKKHLHLHMKRV